MQAYEVALQGSLKGFMNAAEGHACLFPVTHCCICSLDLILDTLLLPTQIN